MRTEFYISPSLEDVIYYNLLKKIKDNRLFKIENTNTLILNISPDYSSIISQRLSHALSTNGEIIDVVSIEVPYPDEIDNTEYIEHINEVLSRIRNKYINFIFVEAGVIRGSNYKMINNIFSQKYSDDNLLYTALFENIHSNFKSDCVGEYYNDNVQDLTFYWETFNNHWK